MRAIMLVLLSMVLVVGCAYTGDEEVACLALGNYDCTVTLVDSTCHGGWWDSIAVPIDEVPSMNVAGTTPPARIPVRIFMEPRSYEEPAAACGHSIFEYDHENDTDYHETVDKAVISSIKFTKTIHYNTRLQINNWDARQPLYDECEYTHHYDCTRQQPQIKCFTANSPQCW